MNTENPNPWHEHLEIEADTRCFGPFCTPNSELTLQPRGSLLYVHWRARSAADLLSGLRLAENTLCPQAFHLYVEFVPPEFEADLLAGGFQPHSEFIDAWIRDLDALDLNGSGFWAVRPVAESDLFSAAAITRACAGASRGFGGETAEWAAEWLSEPEHTAFLALEADRPVGVVFCGLYHSPSRNRQVCWVREVAVLPEYGGRGIGRELTLAALRWGRAHGAGLSFLAVDRDNANAIHLYESIGYQLNPGRGQINLVKKKI